MPIIAVVLPTGRGVLRLCDNMSPARQIAEPVIRLRGRMSRIAERPLVHLEICGAIMPTNPIGPQKAVAVPVKMQQLNMADIVVRRVLLPDAVAKSSPNSIKVRPLWMDIDIIRPIGSIIAIIFTPSQVLPEKLPAAQFQYIFTLVSSA